MIPRHSLLAAILWIGGVCAATAGERPAVARLCPEDAPDGVRLAPRPGCGEGRRRRSEAETRGFQDLGGVKLRFGGRVGAAYGLGR